MPLALQSAYANYCEAGHPEFTINARLFRGVLDYIFYSASLTP
jgi:mRNA deadenylase 3'-5' endonuclease subunit Ccr4